MLGLHRAYQSRSVLNGLLKTYRAENYQPHNWIAMTSPKSRRGHSSKRQKTKSQTKKDGSTSEGVLLEDVRRLLAVQTLHEPSVENRDGKLIPKPLLSPYVPPDRFTEVEVKISELSAAGDGLGVSSGSDHVYVVPFTLPGDIVKAKVINYFAQDQYTLTDFIKVAVPAPKRNDSLVRCPYFSKCSGCQFQMLPYEDQLAHKRSVIERAYRNFSTLTPDVIPIVGDTIESPLQYGYRTKLTPHFDGPPGSMSKRSRLPGAARKVFAEVPPIGFMLKGTRKTIDIEDCPIGTDAIRLGMASERKRVTEEIASFRKGVTLLLRESTIRTPRQSPAQILDESSRVEVVEETKSPSGSAPIKESLSKPEALPESISTVEPLYTEEKICVTDQNATTTEYISDFQFSNPAGAFFQNNNSILPPFTAYIRSQILPAPSFPSVSSPKPKIQHLIDAYCGSGLFTITLSSLFVSSLGIDISASSIAFAKQNALQNGVQNASFMTADAAALFGKVRFPPDETVVVIDPPRKGCDEPFLQQLLRYGPRRVVYVSCNVHTQARDVGVLVEGIEGVGGSEGGKRGTCRYSIESLRGFDFFPQTGHVEGVAVLNRVT